MHTTLFNRFCLLSIVCLVLAFPAWAEEDPNPPQDDASEPASDEGEDAESGEDGPSPSEPCDSDEDCPEGYICEQGYYGDTDYDDGYEDEDEGGEGAARGLWRCHFYTEKSEKVVKLIGVPSTRKMVTSRGGSRWSTDVAALAGAGGALALPRGAPRGGGQGSEIR